MFHLALLHNVKASLSILWPPTDLSCPGLEAAVQQEEEEYRAAAARGEVPSLQCRRLVVPVKRPKDLALARERLPTVSRRRRPFGNPCAMIFSKKRTAHWVQTRMSIRLIQVLILILTPILILALNPVLPRPDFLTSNDFWLFLRHQMNKIRWANNLGL